jgi:hypothetical protein
MSAIHFSMALPFYIVLNIPDFRTFLIAPFDSKHDFESGQFERIDDNELVSRLKKSDTSIDGCSKIRPISFIDYIVSLSYIRTVKRSY